MLLHTKEKPGLDELHKTSQAELDQLPKASLPGIVELPEAKPDDDTTEQEPESMEASPTGNELCNQSKPS